MSAARSWRNTKKSLLFFAAGALVALASFACGSGPDATPGDVHILTVDGNVGPIMSRYIDRGIDHAEDSDAGLVLIRLDTPGGLLSSMDDIVKRIFAAEVPVAVYVWPQGGRAASAGTFITMAAHVAAMAPGTSIGAATPVDISGEDIEDTLASKATNDAAARIRDIALARGRNADWAESAVREAASVGATQARDIGVVEFVEPDLDSLLRSVNGREVKLDDGRRVTLQTAGAPVVFNGRSWIEKFLDIIGDPNIALLLISLGTIALFLEVVNPGAIFPGVFGIIALIFGFFALTVIPFSWAGVALIVVAIILFALEVFITSHGVLAGGGIVALVLGSLLFTSDNPSFAGPDVEVDRRLIIVLASVLSVFMLSVVYNVVRARRQALSMGVETLVGRNAVARSLLDPNGFVFVNGEYWSAETENGPVQPGERVVVSEVKGLRLKVKKDEDSSSSVEVQTEGGEESD